MMPATIDNSTERMGRVALLLGWPGLLTCTHVVEEPAPNLERGAIVRFWYWGDLDTLYLYINENPPWNACVFAMQYGLCSGWHRFFPYKDRRRLAAEADCVSTFLHWNHFAFLEGRQEYRNRHPECSSHSLRRIRRQGYPYYYTDDSRQKASTSKRKRTRSD